MKQCRSFMIRCLIDNGTEENIQNLFDNVGRLVNSMFPDAQFSLYINRRYWKYPKDKEIIFKVSSKNPLKVADFINYIPLNWEYESGVSHSSETKERFLKEEAVWNQYEGSEEVFFLPNVHWVHMYTSYEDEMKNNV